MSSGVFALELRGKTGCGRYFEYKMVLVTDETSAYIMLGLVKY